MNKGGKLLLVMAGIVAFAQAQDAPRLSFDVASIKPNNSGQNLVGIGLQPGGRFTAFGVPLRMLVRQAFRVQDFQIIGGPAWAYSDRYDVEARPPEGPVTPPQIANMIQSLLEDRFKLKFHRETRELPVYELVVAKDGPKLQQTKDASGKPIVALPPPGPPPGGGGRGGPGGLPPGPPAPGAPLPLGAIRFGRGDLTASGVPMAQLGNLLSQQLGRPVIDKTNITGLYDIKLQWTPEVGQGGGPFGTPPAGLEPPPADPNGPSIFTAVQEQLGLRLESTKGPVEVIVIDSVEKPTEN